MRPPESPQRQKKLHFDPGFQIQFDADRMAFQYGPDVFGPRPEYRHLDEIRRSLRDPNCSGPDPAYAIVMDVGRVDDRAELRKRLLLFGVVMFPGGRFGDEPVRSQGHLHAVSPHSGWSTPEIFEVWEGRAIVYGQERSGDDPGRCIAVEAGPGDKVVMPPAWSHFVANANPDSRLIFGAWCDRQCGFDYTQMRAHHGLAWFPLMDARGRINWEANTNYLSSTLQRRSARPYPELGLFTGTPIYEHFRRDPENIQWVSEPARLRDLWPQFEP